MTGTECAWIALVDPAACTSLHIPKKECCGRTKQGRPGKG